MRIAIFTDTYHPMVNGVIVSIDNLSKNLAKRGHKIMIFTVYGGEKTYQKGIKIDYSKGMSLPTMKELKIAVPNTLRILKKIKKFNPDIIHSMTAFGMGTQALICSKALDKPIVYTEHGMLTAYTKYISPNQVKGFSKVELLFKTSLGIQINIFSLILANIMSNYNLIRIKMSSLINKENKKKVDKIYNELSSNSEKIRDVKNKNKDLSFFNKIIWKYFLTFHNNSDLVSTPSEPMKKYMEEHGTKQRIIAISNGIDQTVFKKLRIKKPEKFKIIHVGRVSWEKNIDVTIKAVAEVIKKHPKIEFHICGTGPQLEDMKKLSKSLKIDKNIKFLGLVEHKKLPKHYASSHLFITASTIETEGLVMLEAMSCGLPVIAVDALAAPYIVKNGENGYIVPVNNHKKMAEQIVNLIEKPDLLLKISKNASAYSKRYDLQKIIDKWENIYSDLIIKHK